MNLPPLQTGTLIRRYKRFLADVRCHATDEVLTLHCPNTGRMTACAEPGFEVWFWRSDNARRKYPHTWELARDHHGHMINVNTGRANAVVEEAVRLGAVLGLPLPDQWRREVRSTADGRSRVDLWLQDAGGQQWFIEVKNVTLLLDADTGEGAFPDAVSARASKHLEALISEVEAGHRAALIFNVAHTGIRWVRAAGEIDPVYARALARAQAAGVDVVAVGNEISEHSYRVHARCEVVV